MASFDAIWVIANTLRGVLANSRPPDRFVGAEFKLIRTQDFQSTSTQIAVGISIYMHRVAFNINRRKLAPRVDHRGVRFRPPTAVDLHFLITAWGRSAEEQMEIFGWALRTLQDNIELPPGLLNRFSGERRDPVFGESECVDLIGEILTPQEFVNIWGNTLSNQQPSVSYIARQVLIDSETEMPDGLPVQRRVFDYARPGSP